MIIGFSTPSFHRRRESLTESTLLRMREIGCNAVEFALRQEIDTLLDLELSALDGFEFVSVHAPAMRYGDDPKTLALLSMLEKVHARLDLKALTLHPDLVEDWSVIRASQLPWAIENMDCQKSFGRTVEELDRVVSDTGFPVVLDVNHVFTNDPSMALAEDFKRTYSGRISHVHVSGFSTLHDPLFRTNQPEILDAVPAGLPIIIESGMESDRDVVRELEHIRAALASLP